MNYDKIVIIEWVDSVLDHGWTYMDDARQKATSEAMNCVSVGFVLEETDDYIVIYQGKQMDHSVVGLCQIPKVAITSMKGGREEGGLPARSRKQQRFLFATKGKAWVKKHHFDKIKRKRRKK